jgi:hypothetical protein
MTAAHILVVLKIPVVLHLALVDLIYHPPPTSGDTLQGEVGILLSATLIISQL